MIGSPIMSSDTVIGVICREETHETTRRPDREPRWCFHCRKTRDFVFTVTKALGESYYDPTPAIRCAHCNTYDGDLFPGRNREWHDE